MCWHCCPLQAAGWCAHSGLCKFSIVCFQAKWRFWLQRWRGGFLLLWNRGEHGHAFGRAVQPHAHVTYYVRPSPYLPRLDLWCISISARSHDPHPTQPISTVGAVPYPHWPRLPGNVTLQCIIQSAGSVLAASLCRRWSALIISWVWGVAMKSSWTLFSSAFISVCVWVGAFTLETSDSFKSPTQGSVLVINATPISLFQSQQIVHPSCCSCSKPTWIYLWRSLCDFNRMGKKWGPLTVWLPTFFKIYFFGVQQKKETQTGLEQLEGDRNHIFVWL